MEGELEEDEGIRKVETLCANRRNERGEMEGGLSRILTSIGFHLRWQREKIGEESSVR